MAKKYYWLKLKEDFFKRHDTQIIESMPNGKDYIIFYLKLLLESLSHEGALRFNENIPYSEDMLATITRTNVSVVRDAIRIFTQLGMMEIMDDGTYFMCEVKKMVGSETEYAEKKRLQREKSNLVNKSIEDKQHSGKRQKGDNVPEMSRQCPTEIEIEKEIEKEIEIDKEIARAREEEPIALGIYGNVYLTKGELNELIKQYPDDYKDMIENMSTYMRSHGKYYEDHFATMMRWKREDENKGKAPPGKNDFWSEFEKLKEEYKDDTG